MISTLMSEGHAVAGGDRLGETISFAKNQHHADFIADRFNATYPELAGHFAQVITHGNPYAQSLIDTFGVTEKTPHIAISVDMLDTGIDVPDVVNLVFFKLVRSRSKFWQMISRGTRLRPDLHGPGVDKADFLVFDFCGNLEFFNQDLPPRNDSIAKPLAQRPFEHRVSLVLAIDTLHADAREALANLRGDTALIGVTTIPVVAEHAEHLANLASDEWWVDVTLPMLESAR